MVNNYIIEEPKIIDSEMRFSINPIRVNLKEFNTLNVAQSNKVHVSCMPSNGFQEIFLNLDLEKLRKVDSDEEEQKKFLANKTFALETSRVVVFIMRLSIKEHEKLNHTDIEYIHDILSHPCNDILVPPVIDFVSDSRTVDKERRVEVYDELYSQFIEIKNATEEVKLGMAIPSNYPARLIPELFNYYSDENKQPDFIVMDFGGSRLIDKYTRIARLKRAAKDVLDDPEKKFLYGFNIKPWKKSKDSSISEEMRAFCIGLQSIGPVRGKPAGFSDPKADVYSKLPKAFLNTEYKYHKLNQSLYAQNIEEWIGKTFNKKETGPEFINRTHVLTYNINKVNSEGNEMAKRIAKGEEKELMAHLKAKPVFAELQDYNSKTMKE